MKTVSETYTVTANVLQVRVLSLSQYSEVFSKLMDLYGEEINAVLKNSGGMIYFVIGIKRATDATVEKHEQGQKSVAGNVMVNATQASYWVGYPKHFRC